MPNVDIVDVGGVKYTKAVEPRIWGFTSKDAMRAFKPPRGTSLSLAIIYTLYPGYGTATGCAYIWSDDETTADNDSTVIRPTSIGHHEGHYWKGRWVAMSGCWNYGDS